MLDRLPVRLAIVDASTAICPLVPDRDGGEPSAAVIGRSQLLDALLALFESHWRVATRLRLDDPLTVAAAENRRPDPEDHPSDGYQPDADEARLLSLFVAGVPDKSIASQLGVSRRTVQRRIADLMAAAACGHPARAGVPGRPTRLALTPKGPTVGRRWTPRRVGGTT